MEPHPLEDQGKYFFYPFGFGFWLSGFRYIFGVFALLAF
jgi:hypothetical protein